MRAPARGFAVAPTPVLPWGRDAAAPRPALPRAGLCAGPSHPAQAVQATPSRAVSLGARGVDSARPGASMAAGACGGATDGGAGPAGGPAWGREGVQGALPAMVGHGGGWRPPARRRASGPWPTPRWRPGPGWRSAPGVTQDRRQRLGGGQPRVGCGTRGARAQGCSGCGGQSNPACGERLPRAMRPPLQGLESPPGRGAAQGGRPGPPARAAGLTAPVWPLPEGRRFRVPPWPRPAGVSARRGGGKQPGAGA